MSCVNRPTAVVLACLFLFGLGLAGCSSQPRRIDPTSDEAVTSMGVDYNELVEWSGTLTNRMLDHRFLDRPEYKPYPVLMVVSQIENKTDLPRLSEYQDVFIGRIRAALNNSGKVQYVAGLGYDITDPMIDEERELAGDPRYQDAPQDEPATLERPRLSLRTRILYIPARVGDTRQNTYEVRMLVTDLVTGRVVWEGFSDPVTKQQSRATFGF